MSALPLEVASEPHPISRRRALVADEGDSVWLYLSTPDSFEIAASAWLMNRIEQSTPLSAEEMRERYRTRHLPPPAPPHLIRRDAVQLDPITADDLTFDWSANGDAVAVTFRGRLLALAAVDEPRGANVYLEKPSPWGVPLLDAVYQERFGRPES